MNEKILDLYPYCAHWNDEPILIRQALNIDMKCEDVKSICAAMPHHNSKRGVYVGIFKNKVNCIGGFHVRISENNFRIVDGIYVPDFKYLPGNCRLLWHIMESITNSNKIYIIDTSDVEMFYPAILEELHGDNYGFSSTFRNIRVYRKVLKDVGECWIKINTSDSFDIFEAASNVKIASVSLEYENDSRRIDAKITSPFYKWDSLRRQIDLSRMHVFHDLAGGYVPINCELESLR